MEQVDTVGQQLGVDLLTEPVVGAGAQGPDPDRVAGQEGLRKDHEPGSGVSDFVHRLDGGLHGGVPIQQDRRPLNDCHLHGLLGHVDSLGRCRNRYKQLPDGREPRQLGKALIPRRMPEIPLPDPHGHVVDEVDGELASGLARDVAGPDGADDLFGLGRGQFQFSASRNEFHQHLVAAVDRLGASPDEFPAPLGQQPLREMQTYPRRPSTAQTRSGHRFTKVRYLAVVRAVVVERAVTGTDQVGASITSIVFDRFAGSTPITTAAMPVLLSLVGTAREGMPTSGDADPSRATSRQR